MSNRLYLVEDEIIKVSDDDWKRVLIDEKHILLFNVDEEFSLFYLIYNAMNEFMELTEDMFNKIKDDEMFNKNEITRKTKTILENYFNDGNDFVRLVYY